MVNVIMDKNFQSKRLKLFTRRTAGYFFYGAAAATLETALT